MHDPLIVRHVGIARTLVDRFEELARGPVGVAKLGDSLMNVGAREYERDAAQQLRTGEASQIYPEIWTNLDAAAAALRASGRPTAGFDAVRDAQPIKPVGLLPDGAFDLQGAAAARAAIAAIEAATPTIDWAAIASADAALVDAAAHALGAGRQKVLIVAGAIAIGVLVIGALVARIAMP